MTFKRERKPSQKAKPQGRQTLVKGQIITSKSIKKTNRTSTKQIRTSHAEGIFALTAKKLRLSKATFQEKKKERREGHMKDALALGGEEGRDKLR